MSGLVVPIRLFRLLSLFVASVIGAMVGCDSPERQLAEQMRPRWAPPYVLVDSSTDCTTLLISDIDVGFIGTVRLPDGQLNGPVPLPCAGTVVNADCIGNNQVVMYQELECKSNQGLSWDCQFLYLDPLTLKWQRTLPVPRFRQVCWLTPELFAVGSNPKSADDSVTRFQLWRSDESGIRMLYEYQSKARYKTGEIRRVDKQRALFQARFQGEQPEISSLPRNAFVLIDTNNPQHVIHSETTEIFTAFSFIAVSRGGRYFVAWGNGDVQLRELPSMRLHGEIKLDQCSHCAAISDDGEFVAMCRGNVRIWRVASGEILECGEDLAAQSHPPRRSPELEALLEKSCTWRPMSDIRKVYWFGVSGVRFLPGSHDVVVLDTEGNITTWDAETGKRVREFSIAGRCCTREQ